MVKRNNNALYGIPELGRFGLGHRLLAWARCVIWCHKSGAEMLSPNWFRIPLGPWIRWERDKRLYFRLFRSNCYISGARRLYLMCVSTHVDARHATVQPVGMPSKPLLMVFKNALGGDADEFFPTFLGHHQLLMSELVRMTRPRYLPEPHAASHIAIHVRLGDFYKTTVEQLRSGTHSARLPIDWYAEMLLGIRERLGLQLPAIVYSDGADADLEALLDIPAVERAADQPAITHMLAIAQATLLIGTGSGMSIWGSFLGQVPRLCFPGQRLIRTFVTDGFEPECDNRAVIPLAFVDLVRDRVTSRQ